MSYEKIIKTLKKTFKTETNKLTERYKFKERRQSPTESVMEYLAVLKKIVINYEF